MTAEVRKHVYRRSGRLSTRTYFAGIDVTSTDSALGNSFVGRTAFPRGAEPPVGAVVTMILHAGYLGIPWVDGLAWLGSRPADSPLGVRFTKETIEAMGTVLATNLLQKMVRDLRTNLRALRRGRAPERGTCSFGNT